MGKKDKRQKIAEEAEQKPAPPAPEVQPKIEQPPTTEGGDAHVKKLKNKKKLKKLQAKRDQKAADKEQEEVAESKPKAENKPKGEQQPKADDTQEKTVEGEESNKNIQDLPGNESLTAFQLTERKKRMIFVGNIPVEFKAKQLWKVFKDCGKVEKIWFRSIAPESLVTNKTNIAKGKMYGEQKNNKNAYILFETEDSVPKALEFNNHLIQEDPPFHIRVDSEADKQNDFSTTVFVGNLPYILNEEELREHFTPVGKIQNIRIVRDTATQIGKGIAFIQFSTLDEALKAVRLGVKSYKIKKFKGRELRIKKAVSSERRERKQQRMKEKQSTKEGEENEGDDGEIETFLGHKQKKDGKPMQFHNDVRLKKDRKHKMLKEMMDHNGKSRVRNKARFLINKKRDFKKKYNERREKRRLHNIKNVKKVDKGYTPPTKKKESKS